MATYLFLIGITIVAEWHGAASGRHTDDLGLSMKPSTRSLADDLIPSAAMIISAESVVPSANVIFGVSLSS
jgi:hypothetical protein